MNMKTALFEKEYNERGHDQGSFSQEPTISLKSQAESLSETYIGLLLSNGEVVINNQTHTWQEVLDEDLDNILELQRALHTAPPSMSFTESAEHFAEAAVTLRAAQNIVVSDWAIRTARKMVGL